jgi:hypothetical protein
MVKDDLASFHRELIRAHIENPKDEDEMLLWMLLIHTHAVEVPTPIRGVSGTLIHGATQRAAATALADLWPDRKDREKTSHRYWYRAYADRFQSRTLVPPQYADAIERLRQKLESDSRVKTVILDV